MISPIQVDRQEIHTSSLISTLCSFFLLCSFLLRFLLFGSFVLRLRVSFFDSAVGLVFVHGQRVFLLHFRSANKRFVVAVNASRVHLYLLSQQLNFDLSRFPWVRPLHLIRIAVRAVRSIHDTVVPLLILLDDYRVHLSVRRVFRRHTILIHCM